MTNSSKYNDFTKKALILQMESRGIDIIDFVDFHYTLPVISSDYIFKVRVYSNYFVYFKCTITSDIDNSYDYFAKEFQKYLDLVDKIDNKLYYHVLIKEQILYKTAFLSGNNSLTYTDTVDSLISKSANMHNGVYDFLQNFDKLNIDNAIEEARV